MDDGFRSGKEHRTDVAAVVADLHARLPGAKVFLVGTSRGTVSAAEVGATMGPELGGVVLSSTILRRSPGGRGLDGFDFAAIHAPLLFVHHIDDTCPACPYVRAAALSRRFPLITVHGGKPADSQPCEALSAHGYYGREAETTAAIRSWILGQPFPADVG
jgi:alpha-beta hydrolase superfamily lysophospholipase